MKEYFPVLLSNPLFRDIDPEELGNLLGCLGPRIEEYVKGEPVFLEGDPAGFLGLVLEGAVQIVRDDYYGNRSVLTLAEKGELFAESFACSAVERMPVSGYALQNSKVLFLSCGKMLTVCTNACGFHNRLVNNLLQVVANKNLTLSRKIQYMSRKTTKEKLMAYLLDQAKQKQSPSFTIPFDRQTLADYLGVERSAMSAQLSQLRQEGVLETKGSSFQLLKNKYNNF